MLLYISLIIYSFVSNLLFTGPFLIRLRTGARFVILVLKLRIYLRGNVCNGCLLELIKISNSF